MAINNKRNKTVADDIFFCTKNELVLQNSQSKLHERVKELTCLYGIAKIASEPDILFEEKISRIIEFLPPAWQYPHLASTRIIVDGNTYKSSNFIVGNLKQKANIYVKRRKRGIVEVHYSDAVNLPNENLFLDEEQSLIDNIAGQIALMIEHKETEEMRSKLQEQLIRTDRLAAIGMLAAGVAHELNEPLNTILGFSQLLQKTKGIPQKAYSDIMKITEASLHARRIIKELLFFSRQEIPSRSTLNLNRIIEDELNLLESQCIKSGVTLCRVLDSDLPEIMADKTQILQVLTNLLVNALHTMPDGGVLTLKTSSVANMIRLVVEDTGNGISEENIEKLFIPFFTTKDSDHGTGLGLPVVDGIISSHGGSIYVESKLGQGTRFIIELPHQDSMGKGVD